DVDGRPGLSVPGSEDGAMHPRSVHPRAAVAGKERRVDVDRAAAPAVDPACRENGEEPGQHDELDVLLGELPGEPVRPHVRVDPSGREDDRGDPAATSALDRRGLRPVRDDEGDAYG